MADTYSNTDTLVHRIVYKNKQHANNFVIIILHNFTLRLTLQSIALISLISDFILKEFINSQLTHNIYQHLEKQLYDIIEVLVSIGFTNASPIPPK